MSKDFNFVKDAKDFSYNRKINFPKKITAEYARRNVEVAMILGEVSGTERVLSMILELKKNYSDFTIEDIEAALHEHLYNGLDYISKEFNLNERFSMERILQEYGYYEKQEEKEDSASLSDSFNKVLFGDGSFGNYGEPIFI
jgi:uncharacterized protein (DUF433 family)